MGSPSTIPGPYCHPLGEFEDGCKCGRKAAPFVLPSAPWQPPNVLVFTLGKKELAVRQTRIRSLLTTLHPLSPPLNLLATLQAQPGNDDDNAPKQPEIPPQRRITSWIIKQVFSHNPPPPIPRTGHMLKLHKSQSIPTIGPMREENPRDCSILRLDMPHRDHANPDGPDRPHCLTYASQAFLPLHYLTWTDSSGVVAGPFLTLQDWQSWFCQCLGIAPPALAPYAGQICSCLRQRLDSDHLHG